VNNPPLWKASVSLTKAEAHDVAAAFELTGPQAVLISEEPFKDEAEVEALYSAMPNGDLLSKLDEAVRDGNSAIAAHVEVEPAQRGCAAIALDEFVRLNE